MEVLRLDRMSVETGVRGIVVGDTFFRVVAMTMVQLVAETDPARFQKLRRDSRGPPSCSVQRIWITHEVSSTSRVLWS